MTISTDRATALQPTADLGQVGAVFNDSTRLLDGGLWASPNANNQTPYLTSYTDDISAVSKDIAQVLSTGTTTIGGAPYTLTATDTAALTGIQGELQSLLAAAPASTGTGQAAAEAQNALHGTQLQILSQIGNDPGLSSALGAQPFTTPAGGNGVAFQPVAAGDDSAAARHAAAAQGASLATVGSVFNAAADLAIGGVNASNVHQENADLKAVLTGVHNILASPTQLAQIEAGEAPADAALTTVHLQTVASQLGLELKYDHQAATGQSNEPAARGINDNLLDIIDIVQGDANLNAAAGGNGNAGTVGGFSAQPDYLAGTIQHFQDDAPQTAFWAKFIVGANAINAGLTAVAGGNTSGIQALEAQIQQYTKMSQSFDKAQGGVFGARFDNELLSGTEKVDAANALSALKSIAAHGLTAATAAQAMAAGQGFVADATDVSGNNTPVGGPPATYVGTATTIAGATNPPGLGGTDATAAGATTATGTATAGSTAPTGMASTGTTDPAHAAPACATPACAAPGGTANTATTDPAHTTPAATAPAAAANTAMTDPAHTTPATTSPAAAASTAMTDQAHTTPATTSPAAAASTATTDPAHTTPATTAPAAAANTATTDPTHTAPATTAPAAAASTATTDPAHTTPATTAPAAAASTALPAPAAMTPAATAPAAAANATTTDPAHVAAAASHALDHLPSALDHFIHAAMPQIDAQIHHAWG